MKYQLLFILFIILLFIQKYDASIICNSTIGKNKINTCSGNACYIIIHGVTKSFGCATDEGFCKEYRALYPGAKCCICHSPSTCIDLDFNII
ncbi:hypothetical protein Mgra_00009438 [Meloidogyne graminicola]|uniref:Uncharacterized protein n=1 Tax=Meloidogyne graminicola TaxID=189291 RepID=A0A8S9ZDB6_9BILA|nr:hypothetical protein Mgra_00009438 [Meloidogyne graminicola]